MRTLQSKVESLYQLDRDQRLWLDIALHEVRSKSKKGQRFLATNEFTRRRHKTTALIIHAIEKDCDILVRYQHNRINLEQTLDRWVEEFGLEKKPKVYVLGQHLRGIDFEKRLVADELVRVNTEDLEHVLYQIEFGFIEQESLAELHRQGLL